MSNSLYDKLKFVAQILLPVLGTLYFALAGIWDLPSAEQIVGTIVVVDALLGGLLYISTSRYKGPSSDIGGDIIIKEVGDKKIFSLELNDDPELLEKKDEVTFRIKRSS
jgi:Putative phage holin Dp-1